VTIFLLLAGGLVLLVGGGELLVRGASRLASSVGVSPLVVGLTVVAFGTSAPELAVSLQAARSGEVDIALGNVVGSNIFNVLFILGLSAVITPLVVTGQIIRQEVPIMIGASALLFVLSLDGSISRLEGALLFALLVGYTIFLVVQSRRETKALADEYQGERHLAAPRSRADRLGAQLGLIVVGLVALVVGSRWLVGGATAIARLLGVSELVIGLTVVAAGTSLPEVAASVAAAVKGQRDIAVGNVVGSNTFNILGVLGLSALLAPTALPVPSSLLHFDTLVMLAVALGCLPIFFTGHVISRGEGWVFLAYYVAYTGYLVLRSQQHDALGTYALVMQWVVLPLTVLTLAVSVWRATRGAQRAGAPPPVAGE
jgi:cation:H+ antiporter